MKNLLCTPLIDDRIRYRFLPYVFGFFAAGWILGGLLKILSLAPDLTYHAFLLAIGVWLLGLLMLGGLCLGAAAFEQIMRRLDKLESHPAAS